jgi:D-inositol-3-phosphate glycosyltransferase
VGGLAYLVQDGVTGFTVPVDDPKELADRLEKLLENPELRERMSHKAVEVAQQYSWKNIADQLINTYDQVLRETENR